MNLGPTGTFPQGKINQEDQGAIVIGFSLDEEHGVIILHLGENSWVGIEPQQALLIADALRELAGRCPVRDLPTTNLPGDLLQ